MKNWARRIRGAIKMGLTWAAAGFVAGVLFARVSSSNPDLPYALLFAPVGFIAGVIFSGILVVLGRRHGFDRMSLLRFAGWGALSGLLLTGIFVAGGALGPQTSVTEALALGLLLPSASAVCAAGSLALARRAERKQLGGLTPKAELR